VYGDFTGRGATLVAISPQVVEVSREFHDEKGLPYPLLSDEGNQVAARFGLVHEFPEDLRGLYLRFGIDLAAVNGDGSWTLPMPARYVIDGEGTIWYAAVDPDYTVRPEPEETLAALDAL
jgi:peroxiredoxin